MTGKIMLLMTLLVLVAGLVIAAAPGDVASQYAVTWWTVDSGGGISFGGPYRLSGTIGQPEAGQHSGGPYQLNGGFWTRGSVLGMLGTEGTIYLPLVFKSS
jgi:hypothetical protein